MFMEKQYAEYLLRKTSQDYNLIAADFSRTRGEVWPEMKFLFGHIKEGDKVLDLGCGNGRFFKFFKERGAEYIGVDNSEELIKLAQKKHPYAYFQVADALKLPFPDNFFDKVYSIAVLHHIPSKKFRVQFLKETKRVLKPKGLLILSVWKFHKKKEILYFIKYTILKLLKKSKLDFKDVLEPWAGKIERYYHWFSQKEIIDLAEEGGFRVKERGIIKNENSSRRNIYLLLEK